MISRIRFLITAGFLCHLLLAPPLVTSQLPSSATAQMAQKKETPAANSPCAEQAAQVQDKNIPTICAIEQEKTGDVYQLHGAAEIHYGTYILRADEVSY